MQIGKKTAFCQKIGRETLNLLSITQQLGGNDEHQ